MAASPFERQVVEGDATDERSPTSPNVADGPRQYPPSPSFLDRDRPAVRLVELPAWLQSFAASVGEPSESEFSAASQSSPTEQPVTTPDESPQDQPRAEARPSTRPPPKSSDVGTDFISEDDLPEWLRSIVPDDSAESTFDALAFDRGADGDQITVPNVTRAWSTSKDARGVDETISLFALVASQTPQTALPDQGAQSHGAARATAAMSGAGQVAGYGSDRPPGEVAAIKLPRPVEVADAGTEPVKGTFPILPIAVAAFLMLMVVGAAVVMFIL